MRIARVIPIVAAFAILSACSDSTGPTKPATLEIIEGNAQTGTAGEMLTTPLSVRVLNSAGIPLRGVPVTWAVLTGGGAITASSITSIAGVATATLRLGNTAGVNTASATVEGAPPVTFTAAGVAGLPGLVKISRDSFVTRVIGDTARVTAQVTDVRGNVVDNSTVTWSSSNTAVADVSSAGLITIKGRGTATITGRSQSAIGTMTVRVISVAKVVAAPDSVQLFSLNQTRQLSASAFDAGNVSMPGVTFGYVALTPSIATVSSSGLVTAVANGTARIVVSGEGATDTVPVRVSQVVKTVSINPGLATVPIGVNTQLAGFGVDSLGSAVSGLAFTWSSADTTIAKVSATGLVSGIARGTTTITGRSGALNSTAQITVTVLLNGVTAGAYHTCAIGTASATETDRGFCWGQQTTDGRLGTNSIGSSNSASQVTGTVAFSQLSGGDFHTCGIDGNGFAYCWGANTYGALGDATTTISLVPVQTNGSAVTWISAGNLHTCAIGKGDSTVYCWGNNTYGQLGVGSASPSVCAGNPCALTPSPITKNTLNFTKVSAGLNHTCAIETPSGNVYCWGDNSNGQLGNGTTTASDTAVLVQSAATFTDISAGDGFTCGVTTDARVMCWGRNETYELGIGVTTASNVPVQVGAGSGFTQVSAGGLHACARTSAGAVYCWGSNVFGQIGNNSTANAPVPAPAQSSGLSFTAVAAGHDHTCASTASNGLYCWGRNSDGQLGTTDFTNHLVPTAVK